MSMHESLDVATIESTKGMETSSKYNVPDHATGNVYKRAKLTVMDTREKNIDIRKDFVDSHLLEIMDCDLYQQLRASEAKKRPAIDFMEKIQKYINVNMRAILIDWLVQVAEEYMLVPDTLYLTINYIDRYLSGNLMDTRRLQLLGVACMMIASKYEEVCAPKVEEFCQKTNNAYFKEEVLQMESSVLNFLTFEITSPTIGCFLRIFVHAAQEVNEAPSVELECLASYIAELSLLEYSMLRYAPSLVAASSIFLARFTLVSSQKPWNSTMWQFINYQPSDLRECVNSLHSLVCECPNGLLAIKEKYSQHKYKCVAKKCCPPSIPVEYFENVKS